MIDRFSCADTSRAFQEPCYGTASQIRRWILVEQPGAWGADAVVQSGLPPDVAEGLRSGARLVGARLLLIRRPGRSAPSPRAAFAVSSAQQTRRVERLTFDDPVELADVDWTPLRGFEPVGGDVHDEPLYLVCTNGSHDTCCARYGKPVAAALADALGSQVWEASHFGGDRFAGNLVCLPDGTYYGRVDPDEAVRLVKEHAEGRLALEHYRGRAGVPFVAQAAEHFVRGARALTGLDDAVPQSVNPLDEGMFQVAVAVRGGTVTATVACSDAIDPQQLTCRAATEEHPPRYRLVSLE